MDPLILIFAFGCGYLASLISLPPLVGYLVAGFGLSVVGYEGGPTIQTVADVGVTLLLFSIGLKLKVKGLLRPEVWAGAGLHMVITVAVFAGGLTWLSALGFSIFTNMDQTAILLAAFALSFSSTVFAVKILEESGRASSLNGRTAIGVLIMQDIFAVLFLTLSTGKLPSIWALSLFVALPAARWIFMRMLSSIGHGELQVLFGFFLAFVAGAQGFEAVGVKADLGALIMGMLLADHPRASDMFKSLANIKDFLLVGFFLQIGLAGLPTFEIFGVALLLVAVLPLKAILFFFLFTRFTLKARTSFITAGNLANYSEFGLIVGGLAVANGWMTQEWLLTLAIALSISFIVAAPLNRRTDTLFDVVRRRLIRFQRDTRHPEEVPFKFGVWQVIIIGMGRVGTGAYDYFVNKYGTMVIGVDANADMIGDHLECGRDVAQADVTDPDFWRRLPEYDRRARLVVLAVPNIDVKLAAAKELRRSGYKGAIAAMAMYDDEVQRLRDAGVDTAFNLYGEAGVGLAAHIDGELPVVIECLPTKNFDPEA